MKILTNYDFNSNEIQNVSLQKLATSPSNPVKGQAYYNTALDRAFICTNATGPVWVGMDAVDFAHLTGDGNLHVPATSTTNSGKVLTAGPTAGSLSWQTPTVGTITSVSGTAPVVSSGGATPAISMAAATNAVPGYATAAHIQAIEANTAKVTNATHTGDVTGATALTIAAGAVTLAKMANIATDTFIGRDTAATGVPEALPVATVKTMLGLGSAAYVATTTFATAAQGTTADGAVPKSTVTAANDFIVGTANATVAKKTPTEVRSILNVANGANNYVHPTTAGNVHVPTAGSAGQVLKYAGTSGTASWQTLDMTYLPDSVFKKSVKAATTADLAAASATATTITGTLVVFPAQDGITINLNDRILVKNQTLAQNNGIYSLTTVGVAGTTAWVLTRTTSADDATEVAGAIVNIDSGTQGGFLYSNNFKTTDTLGTTVMPWYKIYSEFDSASINTANKVVVRDGSGNFSAGTITAALTGTASNATTVTDKAITLAKMADMATASFIGRNTAATGVPEVLSMATAKTMLGLGSAAYVATSTFATAAQGTTADGAIPKSTVTTLNDFIVGTGSATVAKKTASEVRTILNVADGANNYTHPSTDGSHHVPATSTTNNGKALLAGATAGSEAWGFVQWANVSGAPGSSGSEIDTAVGASHTHNTDTGTNSATFQVGTSGVKVKNSAGTELQVRNAGDTDYADLRVKNLVVEGTTTTINSNTVAIGDSNIELNSDITTNAQNSDGGITVKRFQGDNVTRADAILNFNSSTYIWEVTDGPVGAPRTHNVARKYSVAIGDGTNTSFVVTHDLNTQDVSVSIRETATPFNIVMTDVACTSVSTVTVSFAAIPTASQYTVTVIG